MQTKDWKRTTVGEAFRVVGGGTPSTAKPEFWNGNIPWISSADIDSSHMVQPRRWITSEAIEHSATNLVPKGSIIVVTRVGLGKVAVAPEDLCFSQDSQALLPSQEKIDSKFAVLQLSQRVQSFKHISRGTTINGITKKQLLDVEFLLPPLDEQQRIVAEIEKQFARLGVGVESLNSAQSALKRYRASVLKAACEGRLVPTELELARKENRTYEAGEQLLQRILKLRRDKWNGKGKYREPSGPNMIELPSAPRGWTWATAGQLVVQPLCNGISVKGRDTPPGIRALRLSAMSDFGFDYSNVRYLPITEREVEDLFITENDFFVSRGNGSLNLVGRGTIAQAPPQPTIFPDTMIRLRLTPTLSDSKWISTLWPSRFIRSQIEARVKTTAGIYKIAQPQVETVAIPLPPLAEQERIVTEIDRRFEDARRIEISINRSVQRSKSLRRSVLRRFFEPVAKGIE